MSFNNSTALCFLYRVVTSLLSNVPSDGFRFSLFFHSYISICAHEGVDYGSAKNCISIIKCVPMKEEKKSQRQPVVGLLSADLIGVHLGQWTKGTRCTII